jgi:Glycoside-hydrolase family GH114
MAERMQLSARMRMRVIAVKEPCPSRGATGEGQGMRERWMNAVLAGGGVAASALALLAAATPAASGYELPPGHASWYWEIDPPTPGLSGLPATSAAYPAPGSANIWDTDLFQDSNTPGAGIPTGASPVVSAIHAAGHYSICYVEAGAYQAGMPDGSDFAPADYGSAAKSYRMQGYPDEWWLDVRGFAGNSATLTGAAVDVAGALAKRFSWCAAEGQDAVEADDLEGYDNASATGAAGGGWGLTRPQAAGFERWIALHGPRRRHGLVPEERSGERPR